MQVNEKLLALVEKAKAEGTRRIVSETTVDEYVDMESSVKLLEIVVPWKEGKQLYREERSLQVPCLATFVSYNVSAFKSRVRESVGDLTQGCSIDIYGYDIERDGEGKPLYDTVEADGEEVHTLRLITKDEEGDDLEPRFLMAFRPQWGIDRSKQFFARLRDQDMLNLVPNRGVPRKDVQITRETPEGQPTEPVRRIEAIDWAALPNLQPALEKPILNARLEQNEDMIEFISHIPIAPNAPSRRAQTQTGVSASVTGTVPKVTAGMETDAFAKPPEKKTEEAKETPKETKAKKS